MTQEQKELKYLFQTLNNYSPETNEYKEIMARISALEKIIDDKERTKIEKKKNDFQQELEDEKYAIQVASEANHQKNEEAKLVLEKQKMTSTEELAKKERRSRFVSVFVPAIISAITTIATSIVFVCAGLFCQKCDNEGVMTSKTANKMFDQTRPKK